MELFKLGAIDIGSNAVRLLIMNIIEDNNEVVFKKSSLTRVPLRLGFDSFTDKRISIEKVEKLSDLMMAYKHLLNVQDVLAYKACATSAMRDASNGSEIVKSIKKKTGIEIDIIDGKNEARIIFENHLIDRIERKKNFLFVDIGGGSTEFTVLSEGIPVLSRSFNIGTIRILNDSVTKDQFDELKDWLRAIRIAYPKLEIVGSGGNINKYFKLSYKKEKEPLLAQELHALYKMVKGYSFNDRIKILGLNPDRADVIIPAGKLFLKILDWTDCVYIHVPKVGVADGIVRNLYHELKSQNKLVGKKLTF